MQPLSVRRWSALLIGLALLSTPVSSAFAAPSSSGSQASPKIALTFDDGPSDKYTAEILDILKEYNVKATFFIIGSNAQRYPELLRRTVAEGHEIGNHTYSHPHLKTIDETTLTEEVAHTAKLLYEIAGVRTTLFRPPEGVVTPTVASAAQKGGYRTVLWSIDTMDWAQNSPANILKQIKKEANDGDIILFHDWVARKSPTPEALRLVIPWLQAQGYTFVTVSEL